MLPRGVGFGVITAIGLAACAGTQEPATGAAATTPTGLAAQSSPRRAATVTKLPLPLPSQLLGMTPVRVSALLGQPELIRIEPPAQVWLYRNQTCIFHVYLYTASGSAGYSVSHIAAVSLQGQALAVDSCFAETITGASHRQQSS
jgi:hypothetical protein